MASVASQLKEEVTAHEQSDSLEDARELCADGTYFSNNLRMFMPSNCEKVEERSNNESRNVIRKTSSQSTLNDSDTNIAKSVT